MGRFDNLERIGRLDPVGDHAAIYRLMVFHEFPWELRMAGRATIWHLFAGPDTAVRVGATDALLHRAEGTSLVFGDLIEYGLDSPTGRDTLRYTNRAHRGWAISADDQRYAVAALAVNAIRWLDRYGWRRPTPGERTAVAVFYAELGRRIGAPGLPRDYTALAGYFARCEQDRLRFSAAGHQVSEQTIAMARARVAWPLRPLVRPVIAALLEPAVRAGVGLPAAPRVLGWAVPALLRVRARLLRYAPARRRPSTPRTRRGLAAPASDQYTSAHRGAGHQTR